MRKEIKKVPDILDLKIPFGSVKNVDTQKRIVQAYGSKFGNIDSDLDMIMPGAFTKTLQENGPSGKDRIFHLWQHKTDQILGKPSVIKEDAYGLYFESEIKKTSLGDDVLLLYQEKVMTEHSIGYKVINFIPEETHYKLTELKLYEVSTVTWGANEMARTVGMKAEEKAVYLLDQLASVKNLLKNGNLKHEETLFLLENIFTNLEAQIKALLKSEPPASTQSDTKPPELDRLFNSFFKHFN